MFQPNAYYYPNQQQQQPYIPRYEAPQLKGRFVSSIDEVKAAQVDFDGSIYIFPDIANKKIYTKQIDMNCNVKIEVYDWTPMQAAAPAEFVTKQEFEDTMAKVREAMAKTQPPQAQPQAKEGFNF